MHFVTEMSAVQTKFNRHGVFPGLVLPYACSEKNSTLVTSEGVLGLSRSAEKGSMSEEGPRVPDFTIYDDENDQIHWFLSPRGRKTNLPEISHAPSTNERLAPRPLKGCSRSRSLHSAPTGDYCTVRYDAKSDKSARPPSQCLHKASLKTTRNQADLAEFSSRLVTSEACLPQPISHAHPPAASSSWKARPDSLIVDRSIDLCTCMLCVKAFEYHCNYDDDELEHIHPCSCVGPPRTVATRWLCMGVLAVFLPCLMCYLPVQLCRQAASRTCSRAKLKSRAIEGEKSLDLRYISSSSGYMCRSDKSRLGSQL